MTANDIYSNDYLRARAIETVKRSIQESPVAEVPEMASFFLSEAENNGCEDLNFLDYLYELQRDQ